jgi:hypothetical protein
MHVPKGTAYKYEPVVRSSQERCSSYAQRNAHSRLTINYGVVKQRLVRANHLISSHPTPWYGPQRTPPHLLVWITAHLTVVQTSQPNPPFGMDSGFLRPIIRCGPSGKRAPLISSACFVWPPLIRVRHSTPCAVPQITATCKPPVWGRTHAGQCLTFVHG